MKMLESTNTVMTTAPKHSARPRLTVLIAAHNEEECIGATLDSILAQERHIDHIVVAADNCTDRTVEIAQSRQAEAGPALIVYETVANTRKKPGALNQAWALTRDCSDLFVCIDADTVLPPNAVGDWEAEFVRDDTLGGCSAKFTMLSTQEMMRLAEVGIVPASVGELAAAELPRADVVPDPEGRVRQVDRHRPDPQGPPHQCAGRDRLHVAGLGARAGRGARADDLARAVHGRGRGRDGGDLPSGTLDLRAARSRTTT